MLKSMMLSTDLSHCTQAVWIATCFNILHNFQDTEPVLLVPLKLYMDKLMTLCSFFYLFRSYNLKYNLSVPESVTNGVCWHYYYSLPLKTITCSWNNYLKKKKVWFYYYHWLFGISQKSYHHLLWSESISCSLNTGLILFESTW